MNETAIVTPTSAYLDFLEVTSVIRKRVEEIETFYKKLWPKMAPSHIFISEIVDSEGNRILENLSFFHKSFWCEAHNFQFQDNFDVAQVIDINHFVLERNEYEPGSPTSKSRLSVTFRFASNANQGILKASGANCDALWKVVQQFLMPLIVGTE